MFSSCRLWVLLGMVITLWCCASPRPLTGGPKDTLPPRILDYASTPNRQTSFREKQITLTFDEWITLKDVNGQLVISPLMPERPEVKQKGKTIIITLPDSLKENTTYTLNFGSAIQDLNEGNKLENFSFIFSTGTFLDSIQLSGQVIDATSLKPAPEIWVMLYPTGNDSIVYRQKPDYLAKTNKDGIWSISNVRVDSFLVVALKDENLDFIYDQDNELFGWLDQVQIADTSHALPEIKVSPREKKAIIQQVDQTAPGLMTMIIPGPLPKTIPIFQPPLESPSYEWVGDSLYIWSFPDINYAGKAILGTDTTKIRAADTKFLKNKPFLLSSLNKRLHPADAVRIMANVPVQQMDTSRIRISKDTIDRVPYQLMRDSLSSRVLLIKSSWEANSKYVLHFQAGAVTDIWGRSNDTFTTTIIVNPLDQFSNLDMNISGLDSTVHYLIQILAGTKIYRTYQVTGHSLAMVSSKGMVPGNYSIELIEDRNDNGSWDTGDYGRKQQPERKKIFIPDNLRAGWDVELKMDWSHAQDISKQAEGKKEK
jgi:uncharacterized protein (DUF2141 family)